MFAPDIRPTYPWNIPAVPVFQPGTMKYIGPYPEAYDMDANYLYWGKDGYWAQQQNSEVYDMQLRPVVSIPLELEFDNVCNISLAWWMHKFGNRFCFPPTDPKPWVWGKLPKIAPWVRGTRFEACEDKSVCDVQFWCTVDLNYAKQLDRKFVWNWYDRFWRSCTKDNMVGGVGGKHRLKCPPGTLVNWAAGATEWKASKCVPLSQVVASHRAGGSKQAGTSRSSGKKASEVPAWSSVQQSLSGGTTHQVEQLSAGPGGSLVICTEL